MRILITGSNGFVGTNMKRYLKKRGYLLTCCDIIPPPDMSNDFYLVNDPAHDYPLILAAHRFDICINAAGTSKVSDSFEDPGRDFQANVGHLSYVLEAIRKAEYSCKLLNISSAAVYGNPSRLPISESDPVAPMSPYGYSKHIAELLCHSYSHFFHIETLNARIFSGYGPGLRKQLFWDIYRTVKNGSPLELLGTGRESRDFIFIDDICNAIETIILNADFDGRAINVATGRDHRIDEAVQTFLRAIEFTGSPIFLGKRDEGSPSNWCADISCLQSLGYSAIVSLKEGLERYGQWLAQLEQD